MTSSNRVIEDINSLKVAVKSEVPKGKGSRECRCCMNRRGLIRTFELDICRRCFREYAADIGFEKVN